jgi:electron transfer flavoprotein alpha subunit
VPAPVPARQRRPDRSVAVLLNGADASGDRALLGEAAVLARQVSGEVLAAVPPGGDPVRLGSWGADAVLLLDGSDPRAIAAALSGHLSVTGPPWALLGSTRSGQREVLARLAARMDSGLLSDLTGVTVNSGPGLHRPLLVGTKPSGSTSLAEIVSDGAVQIATVRTGCLPLRAPRDSQVPGARPLATGSDPAVRLGQPDGSLDWEALERATVVIGVGRGVDPGHYDELMLLQGLLGAELAATRKVTDVGWLPHALQVGVTARDIAPRLYIAIGLSGTGNHMSGVSRAGAVLAINHDPDAPVFGACDVGITADWRQVVPLLTTELARRKLMTNVP